MGGEDEKYAAIGHRLRQAVPHAQLWRMAGVGHNPLVEAPEALAAVLAVIC